MEQFEQRRRQQYFFRVFILCYLYLIFYIHPLFKASQQSPRSPCRQLSLRSREHPYRQASQRSVDFPFMDAEEETVGCGAAFCRSGAAIASQGRSLM